MMVMKPPIFSSYAAYMHTIGTFSENTQKYLFCHSENATETQATGKSFGGTTQRICGVGGRPSSANKLAGGFQQINLNQTDNREYSSQLQIQRPPVTTRSSCASPYITSSHSSDQMCKGNGFPPKCPRARYTFENSMK